MMPHLNKQKRNSHYAFVFARNEEYGYFWNHFRNAVCCVVNFMRV